MREIKFRVWRKQELYELGDLENIAAIGDWRQVDGVLMQFTGLTDKNGKEIYEGDVVAKSVPLFQPLGRGQRVDEVVWGRDDKNTGMWELRLISDDRIKRNPEKKVPYFEPFGLGCEPHNFEVIGNIYENPELINN